jgi:hypothetical protein
MSDDRLVNRIRAEFMEMPGLNLTREQVQRLCGVEPPACQVVLDELVNANFLCVRPDGIYMRVTDGDLPRRHPLKADLGPEKRLVVKAS